MTILVLIRHGQTDWNMIGCWQGQSDPPLNECGRQQASCMAQELRRSSFAALYSSDLRRARETAQIIGEELGLPVIRDSRLREIHLGRWQGMLSAEIEAQYPLEFRLWHDAPLAAQPPGGESIPTLARRVLEAINEIAVRYPDQRIGVVTHELPIAVLRCRTAGLGLEHLRSMIPDTGTWLEIAFQPSL